jgi:hypothetical protein
LIVEILKRGTAPLKICDFDQLVVKTDGGSEVAVVSRLTPEGAFVVSSIDDDRRFHEVLRKLGLHKTTLITDVGKILKPDSCLPNL